MTRIETNEYRVSRSQIAYWSAYEYVRRFWPALIAFPVTGLAIVLFVPIPEVRWLGFAMLLWPLTIVARSILLTNKASRRAILPTQMVFEGEHLYFKTDPIESNYRIHRDTIREITIRFEYVVIEMWKFKLVYLPYSAFRTPEDLAALREATGVTQVQ